MPSPFPGMDPYLEDPAIWPDFHHALASEARNALNGALPRPYYARMEMRIELGVVADDMDEDDGLTKSILPDVLVLKRPRDDGGGVAVLDAPRTKSRWVAFNMLSDEPGRAYFVEIRDAKRHRKLVTLIEILSPPNKRPGADRTAYAAKQKTVLESDTNLIEIDLLRAGRRILPNEEPELAVAAIDPPADYIVMVSNAEDRKTKACGYIGYPATLREPLPCIEVPLRTGDPEVLLDLQAAFNRAYDGGPYRLGDVDYDQPPSPPLGPADVEWANGLLRQAGLRPAS
jgi:Protein of unknown function (DUF4058)